MCWPAIQSTHIPTRLKGHKKLDGRQQGSCHHRCTFVKSCSVAYIAVLVSYDPQEVEAERQQGGAQQVTQSCQVRNGKAVWIFAALPHGVHHPVCYAQQKQHLQYGSSQVHGHKDGCQGCVSALHQVDGVKEDQVTWDHRKEEHLSRAMIGSCTKECAAGVVAALGLVRNLPRNTM